MTERTVVTSDSPCVPSFDDYVTAARRRLFRFAVVLCGDPVLAEDLLADVLGRAYERWPQVAAADDVHAYVRRMLVNEFVSWRRRRARTVPQADLTGLAGAAPDASGPHAERAALLAELARLPRQQRAALVLRYFEDLDDDAIARVLGCRPGTVRSHLSRGLAALRIELTRTQED